MSVLLVSSPDETTEAVIERLVEEGDEVRVVEDDAIRSDRWRTLGAYVARGSAADFDLVERAAQNVRTVVVLGEDVELEPVLQGAAAAGVDRIVRCGVAARLEPALEGAGMDYVVLSTPSPSRWRRSGRLPAAAVAEAINAADDLAGNPRLVVDLGENEGWRALGLAPPVRKP